MPKFIKIITLSLFWNEIEITKCNYQQIISSFCFLQSINNQNAFLLSSKVLERAQNPHNYEITFKLAKANPEICLKIKIFQKQVIFYRSFLKLFSSILTLLQSQKNNSFTVYPHITLSTSLTLVHIRSYNFNLKIDNKVSKKKRENVARERSDGKMRATGKSCIVTQQNKVSLLHLPFPYKMGMWSVASRVLVLMPTRSGEPRRVATHSPGKYFDLKARAKAPSWKWRKGMKMLTIWWIY